MPRCIEGIGWCLPISRCTGLPARTPRFWDRTGPVSRRFSNCSLSTSTRRLAKKLIFRLFEKDRWNVWELRRHLGVVSHDLQHRYLDAAHGINVILSGYYASMDTYEHQDFGYGNLVQATKIMEELGIQHLQDRPFGDMSTGEQRRFLLGRALVHDPEALVLDEPTSGLDLLACFHYLDIIRGLMSKGKTLVLVTHHLHEIPPEVARVVLLKRGRIVADGPKEEILTAPNLTNLFDTPVQVVCAHGWYQILPGR